MNIKFQQIKLRQTPNGDVQSQIQLLTNDVTIGQETQQNSVEIDYATLTNPQKQTYNNFMDLLKSKLPPLP